jgi:hypothetical protein
VSVKSITLVPGFLRIVDTDSGIPHDIAIKDILRAADIPVGLTHTQIKGISALANMHAILIRTLIDRQILDESFMENDDMSLDGMIQAIESMGGSYSDPDIDEV